MPTLSGGPDPLLLNTLRRASRGVPAPRRSLKSKRFYNVLGPGKGLPKVSTKRLIRSAWWTPNPLYVCLCVRTRLCVAVLLYLGAAAEHFAANETRRKAKATLQLSNGERKELQYLFTAILDVYNCIFCGRPNNIIQISKVWGWVLNCDLRVCHIVRGWKGESITSENSIVRAYVEPSHGPFARPGIPQCQSRYVCQQVG